MSLFSGESGPFTRERLPIVAGIAVAVLAVIGLAVFLLKPGSKGEGGGGALPANVGGGGKIVFISDRTGNYDIFTMDADGKNQTRVTRTPENESYPRWSRDGSKIVFERITEGTSDIYSVNPDGTGEARLTDNRVDDLIPDFSPDGKKLAFVSERDGNFEIYVMNADGSGQTRITNHPDSDFAPRWSPDRKSTRLNSSHLKLSRMPSSA